MTKRVIITKNDPKLLEGLNDVSEYLKTKGLDLILVELIKIRTSQINKCAYCIEIHTKIALDAGETPRRLYALPAWQESPLFSDKEKAVLLMTEEIAHISNQGVTDETYSKLWEYFTEDEIARLIMVAISMNAWNRVALSAKLEHKK
ncbi:carboxymuconolactone decarboxylase family protein [Mycoplasma zalophidermidis]|uniref:carboxymuconolactone decarboxylase family protein n=1 Tax=Mycoplasma zalophidermidis TaxID=398174 RepID=UPI00215D287B|nr:carboxymuconolactone decarboxylase family protein [Mycoplasma zalophidermidis]MCR8966752.1 carboxymuconolactone decarboxylase family protein [Mycoplasma zalophidermidis]